MNKHRDKLFIVVLFLASLFMGIGYATVNTTSLHINGVSGAADNGKVRITSVTKVNSETTSNVTSTIIAPTAQDLIDNPDTTDVEFKMSFRIGQNDSATTEHYATYQITIFNDSIYSYTFGPELFNPEISTSKPSNSASLEYTVEFIGANVGDTIPAKTEKSFKIKVSGFPSGTQGEYSIGINTVVATEESNDGIIAGTIKGTTNGDLTTNTLAKFTSTVLNSYQRNKEFRFVIESNNFSIVDASGSELSNFLISGENPGEDYDFYIKIKDGARFPTNTQKLNIYIVATDNPNEKSSIGVVNLTVPSDPTLTDYTPPTINSLTVTKGNTTKTLTVNWDAEDNIGIDHYDLYLYDSNNNEIDSLTDTLNKTHTFENLSDGNYYVKLIAYDSSNSSNESTSPTNYTWTYTLRVTCTNCNANPSSDSKEAGGEFKVTFSGKTSGNTTYNPPNSMTSVKMYDSSTGVEKTLTTSDYHYNDSSTNSYQLVISNITGNVTVTASGREDWTCLIKGTKVLLADGTYKNVEDIRYDDLIMSYSHETGEFIPEYPIWIEKGHKTNHYQLSTFSDGTTLKTIGDHSVFSVDDYEFVSVANEKTFHIGTKILKVEKNDNDYIFKEVTVTNIETVYEDTEYYDIVSTRYYNAITDNILTSDGRPELSNVYKFENNVLWTQQRIKEVKEKNIQASYEQIGYMPYYLYKGLRAHDGAMLFYYNLMSFNDFKEVFVDNLMNPKMALPPITNNNGKRMWMVTTNLDEVTESNKSKYLVEEESIYTLPKGENITNWYSTSENKYYNPGDKVKVWHGMHFIAKK